MDYKEYLDKARIKQLAELQARYNQVYAKERAEAASSLIAGHRQLRRGLQNVGLAGRKGNLISGREKTAALEARRRYREYNAGLSRAANTFTTAAGQRMARQAIDDENRVKRAEAYAKWGDEYAAAKAEAEKEYAAKLEEAKQEHLQYAQEYQNSYNAYLAQQAQYQAWLQQQAAAQAAAQQSAQQELIDPRFQGNNMQQQKQDLMAARAEQQRIQAEIQRLQMQQMAQDGVDPRLSGAQNTQQAKLQAASAARLNTLQRQYASLQEKIQRAEGITKPQNRNEYEIWRDAQNAKAKLNEQAQYAANMQKWQATINQAANITKPTNRYENEALKEAERARQQMAKAQAEMARKEMASKVTGMAGALLQLSDEEFKLRYDAAERAYKLALQNAKILRQDSSSSMDDLSSDADRIEAQATQNFVAFEQANALREQVSEDNLYWNTFKPDAHNEYNKPSVRLIGNLNKGEFQTPIRTQDYLNAVKEYNPQAYNKMHDTDSKYAAAIHEYGRLGVLDSMNVSDAARDLLDYDETFLGKALRHSYADAYDVAMALVMTDEEKNRFDSFLANGQDDKADKYFEYLRDSGILDARAMQLMGNRLQAGIKDEIEKNGKLGLILSTLWTIPANVANGLIQPIASMFDTNASPYTASIRDIPNVMREAVSQNLSQGGAFAYQTGMSIGDSLMSMALGGRVGGVALGGAAYNSAYREALNRGLSTEEARLTAFGTGFNEMLFETLSIGTLLEKTGKSAIKASKSAFVNWLVNTAVQAGVEGSEEVFTDIANNLWDKSVNGIVSEELTSIREYMSQGMTLQQAKAKVQREHAMQLGMSFLGGALSGGVMAGVGQGVNAFMNRKIDKYGQQIVNGEADVDTATLEKFDYKSEQAQEILNSGKLTNTDYGMLAILRVQELVQRSESYINQAVAEGKMPQQIADIYKKFAEHSVQTETNPDGITDEEAEKMLPYVDTIKNAEAIKQGLGKIVEQQTAARKEFDALSTEQKQQRLQNITNETTALRNAPSLRVGASESRLSGQSAAQEFTTRAKTDTITLNNDGSVKTANGSVTFDFGANKTVDAMTDNQARAIRFAAAVANKTGVNIKVEQEFVGDDRNKNGEYNPETNTIRVNLSGTNSAIYTMSHELTHYLQSNNKQAFADLSKAIQEQLSRTDLVGSDLPTDYQDIIGDYLTGDNTLWQALCAYEKERYAKAGIQLTQDKVEEEVIARCCESFLGNSSLIADMTQNHTKSARAVYRFLNEIRADINALRADASERMAERGYASDFSPEQGMLEQFADIDKIVKLWENGLRKAAKKNKASLSKRFDENKEDIRFSLKDNVERKGDLIAVHNLSGDQLLRSIELGGFPMPSIAVMKQSQGHERYGDVSVVFGKDTIDPKKSTANKVYGGDAWTPTYPTIEYKPNEKVLEKISDKYYDLRKRFGYDVSRPLYKYAETMDDVLNREGGEAAVLDRLYDDDRMMQLYQKDEGVDSVDQKSYRAWVDGLFKGIEEKRGIRNSKEYITPSGKSRSFEELHYEETLENVVKSMLQNRNKNIMGSDIWGVAAKRYKSLTEVKKDESRLHHQSPIAYEQARKGYMMKFYNIVDRICDKSESNYFIASDIAAENLIDSLRYGGNSKESMLRYLQKYHPRATMSVVDDFVELVKEISEMPTEYFEAKPERAVGIDEIKAVIMPQGKYAELKEKLGERGIPVIEYDKNADTDSIGNNVDRLRALNSDAVSEQRFSIMDKVRLSTADGTRTFTYGDVTAQMYGNDVTLDGGKVRQRVQMLETLAERYDHVTVDASSEDEARAFENAGAKHVADEFSTGNEYGTYEFRFVESQFKRDSQFDAKQKANFAKAVLKQVGSRRNFTDQQMVKYRAALERAMTYLWNSTYGKGDQMAAYDAVDRLFDRILNGYSMMTEADADMRDTLMSQMRKLKTANGRTYYQLEVTETQMSEILNAYDNVKTYANLLSKALGARVVVKQVDGATMLENTFKDANDSRIKNDTVEGNMPGELLRLAQKTIEKRTNPYESESNERAAKKEAMWDAALDIIGGEKSTQQKIRDAVKETRAEERAKAKEKAEKSKLAEQMERGEFRAKVRREERARYERKLDKLKEVKYSKDEQVKKDLLKVAKTNYQRLVNMLANPTEASHVPVQLARQVSEICLALSDLMDADMGKKADSLYDAEKSKRGVINMDKLIDAYKQTFADKDTIEQATRENPGYDPRGSFLDMSMYDETLVQMMEGVGELLKGKTVKQMDNYELRALMYTLRGVLHTVYDANKVTIKGEKRFIHKVAEKMVSELQKAKNVFGKKQNAITRFLNQYTIESLGLRRIAKLYSNSDENAEFVKLVDDLNEGAIEVERISLALRKMFDPVTKKYAKDMKTWYGKNAEWIDIGNGVKITKGMRVSLAMHLLNEQNLRNLTERGVTIPNQAEYKRGDYEQAYTDGTIVKMTKEQAQKIVSQMTEAEKAYFEVAKEFFHKRAGYYINRTSIKMLGYAKAIVENYFPIQVDDAYKMIQYDAKNISKNAAVEHPGFLETRKGTSNVMYLNDITAVVNRQINGVSKYAGLAIPMRNWNAVMNQWMWHEDANKNWVADKGNVHTELKRQMGVAQIGKSEQGRRAMVSFVDQFVEDLAGASINNANEYVSAATIGQKLTSNYVKAVLTLNARVALSQLASVPTAAAEIPWKYIVQSFGGNVEGHLNRNASNDLIDQYTPIFAMRRAGTQTEVSEVMKRRGFADKAEQKLPGLLGWITAMDVAATRRLWYACERWVKGETNIPVGSDAFYKEVAKRYERVIQNTQPNFTVLQRSPALRSKNAAARIITMFGTQRMQNGGIIIESAAEVVQAKDAATRKSALKRFGRALSGQITAAIVLGLSRAIVAAVRGRMRPLQDDDKDITVGSVSKYIMNEIGTSIAGSFMYVGEIYDFVSGVVGGIVDGDSGYETSFALPAAESLSTIIQFFKEKNWQYFEYISGDHTDNEKWLKTRSFVNTLMTVASYATGLPLANASKTILNGTVPLVQDIVESTKTGELNLYLHQSGKLDSAKTAENYKEWTNLGKKGSVYLAWKNRFKEDTSDGLAHRAELLFEDRELPADEKAILLRMSNSTKDNPLTSKDGVVYKADGTVAVDFTTIDRYRASTMLSDKQYEGFLNLVDMGVAEDVASTAFIQYNAQKKKGSGANDRFRDWLFTTVKNPEDRAKVDMAVVGNTVRVDGTIGYKENGELYADYSSKEMFDLYTNGKKQEKSDAIISTTETPEAKAKAFADTDNNYHAKGGIVYNDKDKVVADFTSDEAYRASQMGESHYEKYNDAVKYGMSKENAILAVEKHKEFTDDDDKDNATQYATWVFNTYKNAKDRAVAGAIYTTKPVTVKDGRTYDENGYIYRDYTSAAWYKLSNRTLSKDGVNKRYEAAKLLEKDGYTAEKTVAAYVELDKLSKKSEWQKWLKDNGYTNDQIKIMLWSRGWAKMG